MAYQHVIDSMLLAVEVAMGEKSLHPSDPCTYVVGESYRGHESQCGAQTSNDCDYCLEPVCELHQFMCNCGHILHTGNCAVFHKQQECKGGRA